MTIKEEILGELDTLIKEGERIDNSFRMSNMETYESNLPEYELRSFLTAALASIGRIAGEKSEYYSSVQKPEQGERLSVPGYSPAVIPSTRGALVALHRAVDAGLLRSLETRLRASIHDDILVQADELLSADYHVAAMVLVGGVLEDHLRKLCISRSISWKGSGSISKYNDLLRDEVYPQTVWRRIQALADVRNAAAHGDTASVKKDDVADALTYTRRVIADYPT